MASEFLRAEGDPAALMDFANSRLAEPFEEQASTTKPGTFEDKAKLAGPPMLCPEWTQTTLCTADVQKDHLHYVIRAWGGGARSQLVREGIASSFEELRMLAFGGQIAGSGGVAVVCDYIGIDARYRQDEVYDFASTDPGRIKPIMGAASQKAPLQEQNIKAYPGVTQYMVQPNYWKDVLHGLIHDNDATRWLPHSEVGPDYCKQMASEHKVHDHRNSRYVWQVVSKGAANHKWDCEVMNSMMANRCGMFVMDAEQVTQQVAGGHDEQESDWVNTSPNTW